MQKMAVVVFVIFVILLTGHVGRAADSTTRATAQATTLDLMKLLDQLFGTTAKPPATTATTAPPKATTPSKTTTTTASPNTWLNLLNPRNWFVLSYLMEALD